jgi:hypothetical protein
MAYSADGTNVVPEGVMYTVALNPFANAFYTATAGSAWTVGTCFADGAVLSQMATLFSRYRVHGLKLHYRPACPTFQPGLWALAFSDDPSHPRFGVNEFSTANYPGISTLETSANCMVFAPWMPWSISMGVDNAIRYVAMDGVYAASTTSVVYDAADIRHTNFGALCCLTNVRNTDGSPAPSLRVGELYWELDIEFSDPSPVSNAYNIPLYLRHGHPSSAKAARLLNSSRSTSFATSLLRPPLPTTTSVSVPPEGKEEKKDPPPPPLVTARSPSAWDDDDEPSPAAVRPTASSVPGGSLYTPKDPVSLKRVRVS